MKYWKLWGPPILAQCAMSLGFSKVCRLQFQSLKLGPLKGRKAGQIKLCCGEKSPRTKMLTNESLQQKNEIRGSSAHQNE